MIVLDANAAIEIARGTQKGGALRSLFCPEEEVVVPALFPLEVTNVAWKYVHAHVFTAAQARALIEIALSLADRVVPMDDLLDEAFGQALFFDHSVYDLVYLILARRNNALLVTLDKRLSALCGKCGVSCACEIELPAN